MADQIPEKKEWLSTDIEYMMSFQKWNIVWSYVDANINDQMKLGTQHIIGYYLLILGICIGGIKLKIIISITFLKLLYTVMTFRKYKHYIHLVSIV